MMRVCLSLLLTLCLTASAYADWTRHDLKVGGGGADGVSLLDVDGDGLLDVAVPWEQAHKVEVYLQPTPPTGAWTTRTVCTSCSTPEDAHLVDLDGDGIVDVLSAHEGNDMRLRIHWGRADGGYDTAIFAPASLPLRRWMVVTTAQLDGQHGREIIAGSKGSVSLAGVYVFVAPANPRDLTAWTWYRITWARWIMGLRVQDMDGDGDPDLIFTDREKRVSWLENTGLMGTWPEHVIGLGTKVRWFDLVDLNGDGRLDVVVADNDGMNVVSWFRSNLDGTWDKFMITAGGHTGIDPHSVAVGDIDLDGRLDIVLGTAPIGSRLLWLQYPTTLYDPVWTATSVHTSIPPATSKWDNIILLDLDGDGDLDIMTTNEQAGGGAMWLANPVVP